MTAGPEPIAPHASASTLARLPSNRGRWWGPLLAIALWSVLLFAFGHHEAPLTLTKNPMGGANVPGPPLGITTTGLLFVICVAAGSCASVIAGKVRSGAVTGFAMAVGAMTATIGAVVYGYSPGLYCLTTDIDPSVCHELLDLPSDTGPAGVLIVLVYAVLMIGLASVPVTMIALGGALLGRALRRVFGLVDDDQDVETFG